MVPSESLRIDLKRSSTVIIPNRAETKVPRFAAVDRRQVRFPVFLHSARGLLLVALLLCTVSLGGQQAAEETEPEEKLFTASTFPKGWIIYSQAKDAKPAETWKVAKGDEGESDVLICTGKPFGYLRTEKAYQNFEFGLEWKYPSDKDGNSGILIHTTGEDKIWPTAIQVQLHAPTAGSIFPSGEAKAFTLKVKDLSKPMNEWNSCRITSRDGKITVVINGKMAGEVTGCLPRNGTIALQSENSEVHFRNIWLKKVEAVVEAEKP